jgi:hypothetical protein
LSAWRAPKGHFSLPLRRQAPTIAPVAGQHACPGPRTVNGRSGALPHPAPTNCVGKGGRMTQELSGESIVVAAKEQVSCDVGGEAAILNMKNGVYYGLDPVGAQVWNLLQTPRRVVELHQAMLREYDVEPTRCERDLIELLEKLLKEGLIELQEGNHA